MNANSLETSGSKRRALSGDVPNSAPQRLANTGLESYRSTQRIADSDKNPGWESYRRNKRSNANSLNPGWESYQRNERSDANSLEASGSKRRAPSGDKPNSAPQRLANTGLE
jgi:hypothetical protein